MNMEILILVGKYEVGVEVVVLRKKENYLRCNGIVVLVDVVGMVIGLVVDILSRVIFSGRRIYRGDAAQISVAK